MEVSMLYASMLLTITFLTVTEAQYYDFFQGFQQVFQQYPQEVDIFSQYNNFDKPTTAYRNDNKKNSQERRTKRPPTYQFDYIFATTTSTPSRKYNRPYSSHTTTNKSINRHFSSDNIEATTNRNRVTPKQKVTTTVKPIIYYETHKASTENVFSNINFNNEDSNNINRPVTENVFEKNHRNTYIVNSHENLQASGQNGRPDNTVGNINYNDRTTSNRNPNVQNIDINNNNRNEYNNLDRPTNNRNPNVAGITNPNRPTQIRETSSTTAGYSNTRPNNNRVYGNTYNNRGVLNTDYDGDSFYQGTPQINRPGVKPAVIDVNQPPITNKPLTEDKNNFLPFDRPFNQGGGGEPEILIGPDEDDMTAGDKRRYINLAEKMCDRYKSLDVKEVVALPLLPSAEPVEFNVTSCVPVTSPLVIGGRVVTINEFPHMALVGWKKIRSSGYSWKCGASLISDQYLLTAGHCTYHDKDYDVESGPPQAVQLGSSYHNDPDATVVKISAVIRHPKYKQRRSYYDLALIRMVKTVRFSEVIRPACLGIPPPVGENIIATGWGRTEFGGDHSEELRSVSLKVWNMAECREIWGTSLKLPNGPTPDSHICAGEKRGGKDTCQGDSGGPAQVQDGCVWRIVAVTSFGRSCGAPNTPALYALTKLPFIAAQVFGSGEDGQRNQDRQFEDRRQPVFSDGQQGYNIRPPYVVNNFRRD